VIGIGVLRKRLGIEDDDVGTARVATRLGWLPALSVVMACGLLLVAIANAAARQAANWAEPAFWLGLIVIVVPAAYRLLRSDVHRDERLGLVVLVGMALFISHFVYAPLSPTAFDEFLHVRTAQDMIATGRLFAPNNLLPVSPYYPGLENVTAAMQQLGGLSIIQSGFVLLAAGRIAFMLALFLFMEQAGGSARLAGLAALVYMANPRFLYFDAQYSYESIALPLAALVLYLTAWRERVGFSPRWTLLLITIAVLGVVVSHHITSIVLAMFLVLWTVARIVLRRRSTPGPGPIDVAVLSTLALGAWSFFVAIPTIGYLGPQVSGAVSQLRDLLSGAARSRELFRSPRGDIAPAWEQVAGVASIAVILIILIVGLPAVWRRYRDDPIALSLAAVALAYPVILVARLTVAGAVVASRSPEFLFLGVGFVAAVALTAPQPRLVARFIRPVPVILLAVVLFVGGVIVGIPQWQRLPGPYLVSADSRSIEPNGIAAAEWTRLYLGADRRFVADRVNELLVGTYGGQAPLTSYVGRFDLVTFYKAPTFGNFERNLIKGQNVEFVIADRRLTTALPVVGFYFQHSELATQPPEPLPVAGLAKFDGPPGVSRVFDNGDIRIYDVTDIELAR
jgi:hypothetical protein